jgi:hypothetical protein
VADLVKRSRLQADAPEPNEYFLTLLESANDAALITPADARDMQMQIMDVLKDNITRYTRGKSSSVREETAQELLSSILYCIDAYCTTLTPEECIVELQTAGIKGAYEKGLTRVRSLVREARALYGDVMATRLDTRLIAYNSTVDEAIPGFFAVYDTRFGAHETAADIDY